MTMQAWDVYSQGKLIETVHYTQNIGADQIKKDLINEGYPTDITLPQTITRQLDGDIKDLRRYAERLVNLSDELAAKGEPFPSGAWQVLVEELESMEAIQSDLTSTLNHMWD